MKFKSKDEIKSFLDGVIKDNGLDSRDHLARTLGVTSSTIYGYIYRVEIPDKVYKKLKEPLRSSTNTGQLSVKGNATDIGSLDLVSLDDLLAEIERRGWKVDLSRMPKK